MSLGSRGLVEGPFWVATAGRPEVARSHAACSTVGPRENWGAMAGKKGTFLNNALVGGGDGGSSIIAFKDASGGFIEDNAIRVTDVTHTVDDLIFA